MSDDFVRDLEEELVAAAQFRARHRARRLRLPRVRWRSLAIALAAAGVLAVVALTALALDGSRDDRAAEDREPTPPRGAIVPLAPMLPAAACRGLDVRDAPAAHELPWLALLRREQHEIDAIPPPQGNVVTWLPVRSFDQSESRLAGYRRLPVLVHAVPSLGVSASGRCADDDGPGLCLVRSEIEFRCFTRARVEAGAAVARTRSGVAVGIVADGIERVTLTAGGRTQTADVIENVYEARLDVPPGTPVRVVAQPPDSGCRRAVAAGLLDRVPVLGRPREPGMVLPRAAVAVLDDWGHQLDAVLDDRARFWGGGGGVEFWAVPVVPRAAKGCAPATGVCVVAVPADVRADAQCSWDERALRRGQWRLAPLWPDNAAIYGTVPDDVTGARVTIDGRTADVDARDGVLGGRLPFPYRDAAAIHVELLRSPKPEPVLVAVVDATAGNRAKARAVLRTVRSAELGYIDGIVPGVKPQPRTDVYWIPGRATRQEAESVAELVVADTVIRVVEDRAPRPVTATEAGVVVVVGSEP